MNRIEPIVGDIQQEGSVDDRMTLIVYALNDTVTPIPEVGNICTFYYYAKTPNIEYDQHPLVAVTDIFSWGFKGYNYHWNEMRQYTWNEVVGAMHVVKRTELEDMRTIPYGKIRLNS